MKPIRNPKGTSTQCGNFRIFLSFRFYVKSNLADFKMSKTAILKALNFDFHETHLMMSKIPKISKFRAPRMTQMADFETLKAPKN